MDLRPAALLLVFLIVRGCSASNNISVNSFDSIVRDHVLSLLLRRRTGVLYNVSLSPELPGVEVVVIRLRGSSFWRHGASVGSVQIPPRALPVPVVRRLVVVQQSIGNWSDIFVHGLRDYRLISPVIGFLVYDATNISSKSEIGIRVVGDPISVRFSGSGKNDSGVKCARFGRDGGVHIGDMAGMDVCLTASTGHFAVVVPLNGSGFPPEVVMEPGRGSWKRWAVGGGVVGAVVVVGVGVVGMLKLGRGRRMEEMEKRADEGERLGSAWVGGSRMPSATMARTQPAIENETTS